MKKTLTALSTILLTSIAVPAMAQNAEVTADLNMRAGPGTQYPVITTIPDGRDVNIYGCESGLNWCDVSWRGNRGWVYSDYLEYTYGQRTRPVSDWGARIDLPVISFTFGDYADRHYRGMPWYDDRGRWDDGRSGWRDDDDDNRRGWRNDDNDRRGSRHDDDNRRGWRHDDNDRHGWRHDDNDRRGWRHDDDNRRGWRHDDDNRRGWRHDDNDNRRGWRNDDDNRRGSNDDNARLGGRDNDGRRADRGDNDGRRADRGDNDRRGDWADIDRDLWDRLTNDNGTN